MTRAFTARSPAVAGACARHAVPSEYKGTSSSGAAEAPPRRRLRQFFHRVRVRHDRGRAEELRVRRHAEAGDEHARVDGARLAASPAAFAGVSQPADPSIGVPQNGRIIRSVALSPTSAAASTAAVSPSRSLASNVSSSKMRTVSLAPAGAGQQYDHRGDTVFDTVSDLHAFFSPSGVWKVSVANGSEVSTPKSAVSSLRSPLAFITQTTASLIAEADATSKAVMPARFCRRRSCAAPAAATASRKPHTHHIEPASNKEADPQTATARQRAARATLPCCSPPASSSSLTYDEGFLEKMRHVEGVLRRESGLMYRVLRAGGGGAHPLEDSLLRAHLEVGRRARTTRSRAARRSSRRTPARPRRRAS